MQQPPHDARHAAHEAALAASGRTLHQAHKFAALHATAKPLFEKVMRRAGSRPVLVRIVFPGVLLVCDPATGEVLARLLIPHAQAAFALLGTDATDVDAAAIVRWVQAHGLTEFTKREAQKAQEGRFRSIDRLQKALDRLEHQDVVRAFKRHNKGAPPSSCFSVNPKALSA